MSNNGWLRLILVLWVVGYLLVACGPAIVADGISGTLIGAALGLVLGSVLFAPWVVGVVVLIGLIWYTDPGRRIR
jgi:hypothetical protein